MGAYIAVDIGGTKLRAALFPSEGLKPLRIERSPTKGKGTAVERLQSLISSIWPKDQEVTAISVAAPGPVNPAAGIVLEAPNIPGWVNLPLRQALQTRFNTLVVLGNDANLAALGEWKYGSGVGHHNLIYMTISTGIGGGIIVDDRLLLGLNGLAAEIGHITVLQDGPLCNCGHRGHLEAVASGTAIARWVQDELASGVSSILAGQKLVTAQIVAEAAQQGDELCVAALARAGYFLGEALADFLHIFNPSMIILGGGASQSGNLLLKPMEQSLREHVMTPAYLEGLTITMAKFGDNVGLIGALALGRTSFPPEDQIFG